MRLGANEMFILKNYTADLSGESKQASGCGKATQSSPCTSNHCIVGFIIRGLYLDGQTLKHSHPLVLGKIKTDRWLLQRDELERCREGYFHQMDAAKFCRAQEVP